MDPDILEKYQGQTNPYSIGSSSSHPRRIDGDIRVKSGILGSIRVLSPIKYFRIKFYFLSIDILGFLFGLESISLLF